MNRNNPFQRPDGNRSGWRRSNWERRVRGFLRGGGGDFPVTRILIMSNLVLFTLMVLQGIAAGRGLAPVLNPDGPLLIHSGGQFWPLVLQEDQWWRCITYAFTHGGLIHLAFNMIVLYQVGPLVEMEIGRSRFLFLYTFAALTGTAAGYLWHPMVPVVGASGSLFGLIGFAAAYYHRMGDSVSLHRRNFMLQWALFAFVFGLIMKADNAGHLGGAIGGGILGFMLPIRGQLLRRTDPVFIVLGFLSAGAILVSLGMLGWSWFR